MNFYGNVEGNDIFKGTVDVVVCDGFVGNVVLKSVEGLAKMLSSVIREEFKRNLITLLAGALASRCSTACATASTIAATTAPPYWACVAS